MAWKVRTLPKPSHQSLFALAWPAGFLLVLYAFFAVAAMRAFLPWVPSYLIPALPAGAAGFIFMVGGFAWLPGNPIPVFVPGPLLSRFFLLLIFGVAGLFFFQNFTHPPPL